MSIKKLGSRAIIGAYYAALDQYLGDSWIDAISMHFDSDQASDANGKQKVIQCGSQKVSHLK